MELERYGHPRVVITGLAALTPLGTFPAFWEGIKAGRSGIRRIRSFDASHLNVQIAGEVDFNPTDYLDFKEARRMARASQMAQVAARMAMQDAGLTHEVLEAETERVAVSIGTAQGGYEVASHSNVEYKLSGRKPNPFALINALPNMPGHYVSCETHATGPLLTVVTGCASSTHSIGEGMEMIRQGQADIVFAGGVEALIQDYVLAALDAMTALATGYNDNPEAASRPFDADRCGFAYSEGAAMLVLESLEHALKRSAPIYAEALGWGASADAFHVTAPDSEGKGAQKAIRRALEDAHLNPGDIDYINAHGTSTKLNDAIETLAIKRVFGDYAYKVPVSSTKSMIGHCLGGSGAIEAVVSVMALVEQVAPPTINYTTPDPECDLDYVPNAARDLKIGAILSNSFGFGGQNACLVLGRI